MKHFAILDESTRILEVSEGWRAFGQESGVDNSRPPEGTNFLDECAAAVGGWSRDAAAAARAIAEILTGDREEFRCRYRCDGPGGGRWYEMQISRFQSDGRWRLLVVHEDVTERRAAEEMLKERVKKLERLSRLGQKAVKLNEVRLASLLRLFERSAELDEKEIIQFALEEAVELTLSAIGYCHLVHDDQSTIELVTWSRATLEVCDAVHDRHYPLAQAGVWADCARIQAPVVHNDYPNLPERRGLPKGHAEVLRHASVPVVEDGKVRLIMGVGNKAEDYDDSDVRQLQLLANDAWQAVRRKRVESRLRLMAMTDPLTGLSNRRWLFDRGEEEVKRVRRYGGSLSVLFMDIDSFKSINDRHGHDVGDDVLKEFASTVRRTLRGVDMVGRVGGEEFVVILPNTSRREARVLAGRLAEEVRRMRFSPSGSSFGITVSIGVASCTKRTPTFPALLKAADRALYGAKGSGRDGVFG